MPIYEYICLNCNSKFEHLLRTSSEIVSCPKCQDKNLKRLMSVFAFSSKDASGNITGSSWGCGTCTSHNCSSCSG